MSPFSKRKDSPNPIAFRLPDVSRQQLDDLMAKWGENQSQAIIRCIERIWTMEVSKGWTAKRHSLPLGNVTYTEEAKQMNTKIASVQSQDGNLELVLCSASVELRLSPRAAQDFDRAIEKQKDATWLPIWKQIKAGLLSAAQFMGHHFADTLKAIPLEAVDAIAYQDGRLYMQTAGGNVMEGLVGIKVGSYTLDCDLGKPGVFAEEEVLHFMQRFNEVQPIFLAYLQQLNISKR